MARPHWVAPAAIHITIRSQNGKPHTSRLTHASRPPVDALLACQFPGPGPKAEAEAEVEAEARASAASDARSAASAASSAAATPIVGMPLCMLLCRPPIMGSMPPGLSMVEWWSAMAHGTPRPMSPSAAGAAVADNAGKAPPNAVAAAVAVAAGIGTGTA
jgi:hypothetical protein